MPVTLDAIDLFHEAGGVAVSALEMHQNASRDELTFGETEKQLKEIMKRIHATCRDTANEYDFNGNYVHRANIAEFKKAANSMLALGLI